LCRATLVNLVTLDSDIGADDAVDGDDGGDEFE
jgi:hypothetical protein